MFDPFQHACQGIRSKTDVHSSTQNQTLIRVLDVQSVTIGQVKP